RSRASCRKRPPAARTHTPNTRGATGHARECRSAGRPPPPDARSAATAGPAPRSARRRPASARTPPGRAPSARGGNKHHGNCRMSQIVHISDTHFGTEDPAVVDALLSLVRRWQPSLLVLSGDITQRARSAQFAAAKSFLDQTALPWLAIP